MSRRLCRNAPCTREPTGGRESLPASCLWSTPKSDGVHQALRRRAHYAGLEIGASAAAVEQKFDFTSDFWYNAPSALHRHTR